MLKEETIVTDKLKRWLWVYNYLASCAELAEEIVGERQELLERIFEQHDINLPHPNSKYTYLFNAVVDKNVRLVKLILKLKNVDTEQEINGHTALGMAVFKKVPIEIIEALISGGANINVLFLQDDNSKINLLHLALRVGNDQAFDCLLNKNADPNLHLHGEPSFVPLIYCAAQGQVDKMKLLLQHGAKPNLISSNGGASILHKLFTFHINRDTVECLKLLLQSGADSQVKYMYNNQTSYALFIDKLPEPYFNKVNRKSIQEQEDIIRQVLTEYLKYGIDPTVACYNDYNLITLSIIKKQNFVLKFILSDEKYGKSLSEQNANFTPLIAAVTYENIHACDILINAYKKYYPNRPIANFINQPLTIKKENEDTQIPTINKGETHWYILEQLRKRKNNIPNKLSVLLKLKIFDQDFCDLICHIWATNKFLENEISDWVNNSFKKYHYNEFICKINHAIQFLPYLTSESFSLETLNESILFNYDNLNFDEIKQKIIAVFLSAQILDQGAPSLDIKPDCEFYFPAGEDKELDILRNLLSHPKIKIQSLQNEKFNETKHTITFTALFQAFKNKKILNHLLNKGLDITFLLPETKQNILHFCLASQATQNECQTILHLSDASTVINLLQHGDKDGFTPLHFAAMKGCVDQANHMINLVSRIEPELLLKFLNSQNNQGGTALFYAANYGQSEIVHLLLNAGADPDIRYRDNTTAFFAAITQGYFEVSKIMMTFYKQKGLVPQEFDLSISKISNFIIIKAYSLATLSIPELEQPPAQSNTNNIVVQNDNIINLDINRIPHFEVNVEKFKSGFGFLTNHFGYETVKSLHKESLEHKNFKESPEKIKELAVVTTLTCFNHLLTSTMSDVKTIANKTPNCRFFLDIVSLWESKVPESTILKYAYNTVFFAAHEGDQGLVKLRLKALTKSKKEVTFNVIDGDGKVAEFTGYVSHEYKTLHSEERVIVAKVKGDKGGAYYIGIVLLNHGLHTAKEQQNFFKKYKKFTFYPPTTDRYKQVATELKRASKKGNIATNNLI
jgi:ankyrin repeat protein